MHFGFGIADFGLTDETKPVVACPPSPGLRIVGLGLGFGIADFGLAAALGKTNPPAARHTSTALSAGSVSWLRRPHVLGASRPTRLHGEKSWKNIQSAKRSLPLSRSFGRGCEARFSENAIPEGRTPRRGTRRWTERVRTLTLWSVKAWN